jgi:hypothetical protein
MVQMQLNLEEGRRRKRDGQRRALDSSGPAWQELAMTALKLFLEARKGKLSEFKFEEFRFFCAHELVLLHSINLPAPRSSAVWGSLPQIAKSRGLIRFTGRYEPAMSPDTHAHPVKVWAVCNAN